MSVLAERVLLSRSGITRLVDRLVAAGMVERSACVTDARGAEAALTAKGLDTPPRRRRGRTSTASSATSSGSIPDADRDAIERGCNGILDELGPRRDRRLVLHDRERPEPDAARSRGRLYAGTSGFAYPGWAPRFYPPSLRGPSLLPHYASRLPAVELNNTFYARPTAGEGRGVGRRHAARRSASWSRPSAGRPSAPSTAPRRSPSPG